MNNDDEEYLPNNERNQLMKKYYATMKVADKFWKIWQRDHLQSLRENQRVYLQNRKAKKGGISISDENIGRAQWKFAKIVKLKADFDGEIRTATLKMTNGQNADRSIMHLCPLELTITDEITQMRTKNEQRTEYTQSNNNLCIGRHAAITWITACLMLNLCGTTIATTKQCNFEEPLTFVSSQKCVTNGVPLSLLKSCFLNRAFKSLLFKLNRITVEERKKESVIALYQIPTRPRKGCYNCLAGAKIKYQCTTDFGNTLAYVDCKEVFFVMQCSNIKREETAYLSFTHSNINLNCKVKCSTDEKRIALQAVLGYVPTIELIKENSFVSANGGRRFGRLAEIDLLSWLSGTSAQKFFVTTAIMGGILVLIIIRIYTKESSKFSANVGRRRYRREIRKKNRKQNDSCTQAIERRRHSISSNHSNTQTSRLGIRRSAKSTSNACGDPDLNDEQTYQNYTIFPVLMQFERMSNDDFATGDSVQVHKQLRNEQLAFIQVASIYRRDVVYVNTRGLKGAQELENFDILFGSQIPADGELVRARVAELPGGGWEYDPYHGSTIRNEEPFFHGEQYQNQIEKVQQWEHLMYVSQEYADDRIRTAMMSTCAAYMIPPNNRQAELEFVIPYKEGTTPEDTFSERVKSWVTQNGTQNRNALS
ncbi:unnamed protein product [Enterobius vermicularis]|uniref:DUF5641 domain-containing protein n=1 Tax=Enterobius vermicularis TaxID=51028 RepID=A0A0N4V380_ENTVE|nr:unnamed protein product [Enterobius vermicularis]